MWLWPSIAALATLTSVLCNVDVQLDAKWKQTPFLLEASEFISEEGSDLLWTFIDRAVLVDFTDLVSEREVYDATLKLARPLLSDVKFNLLKFSLSLRSYSPRIIMYKQMSDEESANCDTFLKVNGRVTCDIDDLEKLLAKTPEDGSMTLTPYDHIMNPDQSSLVLLHGRLGDPQFNNLHVLLSKKCKDNQFSYGFRHSYKNDASDSNVVLSGYGVELAIKSTEYKAKDDSDIVEGKEGETGPGEDEEDLYGFKFSTLRKLYPELSGNISEFKQYLIESHGELADMKVWQMQDLSLQAAQIILNSPKEQSLSMLQHISQNFPVQARIIFNSALKSKFKSEIAINQQLFAEQLSLDKGDSAFFINGLSVNLESNDIFSVLETLKSEASFMQNLFSLGIKGDNLEKLKKVEINTGDSSFAVDYRMPGIVWLNDLSRDRQYANWPGTVQYLLRPQYPGMLTHLRKNIFNMIFIVDVLDKSCHSILKSAEAFLIHNAPVRIGLTLLTPDPKDAKPNDPRLAIFKFFTYIKKKITRAKAIRFLTDLIDESHDEEITYDHVISQFVDNYSDKVDYDTVLKSTKYNKLAKEASTVSSSMGLTSLPQVLINGVPIDPANLNDNKFEESVIEELQKVTRFLQNAVQEGDLKDHTDLEEFICTRDNVVSKLNGRILNNKKTFVKFSMNKSLTPEPINENSPNPQISTKLLNSMKYISKAGNANDDLYTTSTWIVADLTTAYGRRLVSEALKHLVNTPSMRVSLVHSGDPEALDSFKVIAALAATGQLTIPFSSDASPFARDLDDNSNAAMEYLAAILDDNNDESPLKTAENIDGIDLTLLEKQLDDLNTVSSVFQLHSLFVEKVLKFKRNQSGIIINGIILGPFDVDETFVSGDFKLLEGVVNTQAANKIADLVDNFDNENSNSDMVVLVSTILLSEASQAKRSHLVGASETHSVLTLPSMDPHRASYDVVAILDPVSRQAQIYVPLIITLMNVLNANVKIFMNCQEKLSSMPVKNFYQYLVEPEPKFEPKTGELLSPRVTFTNLPGKALLTLGMKQPESWLIESVRTPHDLDNIQLSEVKGNIHAVYELEYILLEGHCHDDKNGQPSRGLQFMLNSNSSNVPIVDTIVMANLGYLQLKASPGAWNLELRTGKSSEIYFISSYQLGDEVHFRSEKSSQKVVVFIESFQTHIIRVKVKRKTGMETASLLTDDNENSGGIWESISNTLGGSSTKSVVEGETKTLNIFSLASGHLYERFLRIMMLSVLKNTKQKVKFWFLKNYLSSSFKEFIPIYSKHYNFDYELVQYKWPRWLHKQTEKQRIIWGYKILFLDVLFPLDVDKIIFVDADQIVRTDLQELVDLDLEGAAYGYTPFCDSRKEMDGFRFWNSGYWRNHLNGRKYHISALYVVDLKQFKRIAAGDRLRGQYQGLSQDPNSLSNLDQDLPNNMIHQVPMKSLPQEWLWCETWCSNEQLKTAKTIDLCNNPQTKEPKLSAAARIVPEWTDYDNEIKSLFESHQLSSSHNTHDKQSSEHSKDEL